MKIINGVLLFTILLGSSVSLFGIRPHLIAIPFSIIYIFYSRKFLVSHILIILTLLIISIVGASAGAFLSYERYYEYSFYLIVGLIYFEVGFLFSRNSHFSDIIFFISIFSFIVILIQYLGGDLSFMLSEHQSYSGLYGNVNDNAVFILLLGIILWGGGHKSAKWILFLGFFYSLCLDRRLVLLSYIIFYFLNIYRASKNSFYFLSFLVVSFFIYFLSGLDLIHFRNINFDSADINSSSARLMLLQDFFRQLEQSSLFQLIFGHGLGQLNVIWPYDGTQWASLHFTPLEYYYYLGVIVMPLFLCFLCYNFRVFIPIFFAILSMSSTIYFIPFYFFLGIFSSKFFRSCRYNENFISRPS